MRARTAPGSVAAALLLTPTLLLSQPASTDPGTLEDIYGDTGNTFQAAVGFPVGAEPFILQPA